MRKVVMLRGIRGMVVLVLAAGLMWHCGGERVMMEVEDQVGQPLSKLAVQGNASGAVVVAYVRQDEAPVSGAMVEFARSVAGQAAARLLVLTGLVNADGVLAAGVRVETQTDTVVADGSADYFITAAGASPNLEGRRYLYPPVDTMPQVVYLGDDTSEEELLDALASNRIDALARGEIGNRNAAHASNGAFVVTALDAAVEYGGFTLDVDDADLATCIDDKINYLTDDRRIGYGEWRQDSSIFMTRARMWKGQ